MALTSVDATVRAAINELFLEHGAAPTADELMRRLACERDELFDALRRLEAQGSVALRPGTMDLWLAPPWSATPTAFRVRCAGRELWASGAWHALGIPVLAGASAQLRTALGGEGGEVALELGVDGPRDPGGLVVHFAVPPRRWPESLAYACDTTLLFDGADAVADWAERRRLPLGAVVPLAQAWRLAVGWFGGATAAAPHLRHRTELEQVFRDAGLGGPFFALRDRAG